MKDKRNEKRLDWRIYNILHRIFSSRLIKAVKVQFRIFVVSWHSRPSEKMETDYFQEEIETETIITRRKTTKVLKPAKTACSSIKTSTMTSGNRLLENASLPKFETKYLKLIRAFHPSFSTSNGDFTCSMKTYLFSCKLTDAAYLDENINRSASSNWKDAALSSALLGDLRSLNKFSH